MPPRRTPLRSGWSAPGVTPPARSGLLLEIAGRVFRPLAYPLYTVGAANRRQNGDPIAYTCPVNDICVTVH